jgi:hypothetical protein
MKSGISPAAEMATRIVGNERHPDIFTPEEAAEYLRLESVRTLDWLHMHFKLHYQVMGTVKRYHREDLDSCVLRVFGKGAQATKLVNRK